MSSVTILMSTYNGEKYLEEQIESLIKQKNVKLDILVRDDGSTDNTIEILEKYKKSGNLKWYSGENLGPARSFMDLIYHAPQSEYYALCDQDDVWMEDKISIALCKLESLDKNAPALYYGRPKLVNNRLEYINNPKSSLDYMLTFPESIINSNATGCTMVFNNALMKKIKNKNPKYMQMHDAWLHKVCAILHGQLLFDNDVHILYRQHSDNVIGISNNIFKKIRKKIKSLTSKECSRSKTIKSLYDCYKDDMCDEYKNLCIDVINYKKSFLSMIKLLKNKNIKTKYRKRNFYYKIAVLLKAF